MTREEFISKQKAVEHDLRYSGDLYLGASSLLSNLGWQVGSFTCWWSCLCISLPTRCFSLSAKWRFVCLCWLASMLPKECGGGSSTRAACGAPHVGNGSIQPLLRRAVVVNVAREFWKNYDAEPGCSRQWRDGAGNVVLRIGSLDGSAGRLALPRLGGDAWPTAEIPACQW